MYRRGEQVWTIMRTGLIVLLFAILLVTIVHADQMGIWSIISHPLGDAALSEEQPIRVVSYNIRHGQGMDDQVDLQRIVSVLQDTDADIIALQEVDRYQIRSGFQDQAAFVAFALGMQWVFSPSVESGIGQYGNAILSRYPIVKHESLLMPGAKERRSVLKAVVQIGEQQWTVCNTHLGVSLQDRQRQFPMLLNYIEDVQQPALLVGDFNMGVAHSLMQEIPKSWRKLYLQQSDFVVTGEEIDHMYLYGAVKSAQAWTIPSVASDHLPIVAHIE